MYSDNILIDLEMHCDVLAIISFFEWDELIKIITTVHCKVNAKLMFVASESEFRVGDCI